jgi:membrane fusion protein (multidrug efflux system)
LRRHFFLIAALAALVLMALVASWRVLAPSEAEAQGGPGGPGGGGGGRAAAVRVVLPEARPFTERLDALGQAKARQSVTITSNTTELITRVLFSSGQFVRRGQVLVELKAEEQGADVVRAQASANQARREYERFRELGERGFAPRARVEELQAAYQEAQATLKAVQARRQDRVIRAPFSGVIGLSDAAPGQLVNPGAAIATLDDLGSIYVDFDVPERYLGVLRQGMPLAARSDAYPDEAFRGSIQRIDTRVDPNTRAVTARAEFANPGGRIKPGMLLRVSIEQESRQGLAVPESAVQFQGDQAFVFVVAPGAPRGAGAGPGPGRQGGQAPAAGGGAGGGPRLVAQRRPVRTGAREAGFVEVLSGLAPRERVVADGLNRVNPGQPVRIAGEGGGAGARRPGSAAPGAVAR